MTPIKVRWQAADGYVGGSRPHWTKINPSDFEGLDRREAEMLFDEILDEDFRQKVSCECDDYEAAITKIMNAAAAPSADSEVEG